MRIYTLPNGETVMFQFKSSSRAHVEQQKLDLDGAFGCLGAARNLRLTRLSRLTDAIREHGWHGPLISGVEQEHWPTELKDRLRANARAIGDAISDARKCWDRAGFRHARWLSVAETYRVDGIRY